MNRSAAIGLVLVACLTCPSASHARGGGGCFLPDTPILRPDGSTTPIRLIQPGDQVLACTDRSEIVTSTVRRTISFAVDEYFVVTTAKRELQVTGEHPFYAGGGNFRPVDSLRIGDVLYVRQRDSLAAEPIISIRKVSDHATVFNLQTDAPFTYFADGILVHNKGGGCFLADTPILCADGTSKPIQNVRAGDRILAFAADGRIVDSAIRQVITYEVDEYFELQTVIGQLRVTGEHPFLVERGEFRSVQALQVGDSVFARIDGALRPVPVLALRPITKHETVYNLTTDDPFTYFADTIAVHNKGGGGGFGGGHSFGGHGGSGSGSADWKGWAIAIGIFAVILVVQTAVKRAQAFAANLDYSFSSGPVRHKAEKTARLLDFLARQDPTMKKDDLIDLVKMVFVQLQTCWQARDYASMKPLLMPDLFAEHESQLQSMRRSHEINRIENLDVKSVDIVFIRYTQKPEQRAFTALVTAVARDYYVDDRTSAFLRGDHDAEQFQEFWTFHRHDDSWLVGEIEQTKESDALTHGNFVEMFTDAQLDQIYRDDAGAAGVVGPEMPTAVKVKGDKIDRMLNFLEQTSPIWKRPEMLRRVREIFFHIHQVQEAGDPQAVSESYLFPDVAANLREVIQRRKDQGVILEFRNLCLRKIDILLVRNRTNADDDEFTVRVRSHAQKTISRGGTIVSRDDDVTPTEECWTLGHRDSTWKLKEILPASDESARIRQENLDEEMSPEMVQWYYTKSRAN